MGTTVLEKLAQSASWILWLGRGIFLSAIIILISMRSLVTVVRIDGQSMEPALRDGEWVVVDLISKRFSSWRAGEIVILKFPGDPLRMLYVKRIIGIPGDRIKLEGGRVVKNGQVLEEPYLNLDVITEQGFVSLPEQIPPGQYLVLGDNRYISNDSRFFGLVPDFDLIGRVMSQSDYYLF